MDGIDCLDYLYIKYVIVIKVSNYSFSYYKFILQILEQ